MLTSCSLENKALADVQEQNDQEQKNEVSTTDVNQSDFKNKEAHIEQADIWLDTVFGHCMANVTGSPLWQFSSELKGEWSDLRPDYANTLLQPLYNPKEISSPHTIILDISESKESCWTQHSNLVPEYVNEKLTAIFKTLEDEGRIKTAFVDQGRGAQEVGVILVGETREPVIFYQSAQPNQYGFEVVTIVQKTVDDFVYKD